MNPDRIRAAIRMLYPAEMTPTARNVLENILDDEEHEAPVSAGAYLYPNEDEMSEYQEALITAMAKAIGSTFGKPELDWTEEAHAALMAYREFVANGRKA